MLLNLLKALREREIPNVSWKNNHELELVLNGDTDLDLYVPKPEKRNFLETAQKHQWLQVKNPVADYPDLCHFYGIGKDLKVYHIHVYFQVITGESWLKEYNLPIGDFLINNRVRSEIDHLYVLNGKSQAYLFALRHFLKGGSISSRILYVKELKSYQMEWKTCSSSLDASVHSTFLDLSDYMDKSGFYEDSIELPSILKARKVRKQLYKYLRFYHVSLPFRRVKHFFVRLLNKSVFKRKKIFLNRGYIIVITGADGAGKTTMIRELSNFFSTYLTTKTVALGKPQGKFIEWIRSTLMGSNYKSDVVSGSDTKNKEPSVLKCITSIILASLRYRESKKALKIAQNGELVISDRWPTMETGKMDGPKIDLASMSSRLKIWMAKIEKKIYQSIPDADCSIILTIPSEVAVKRNRKRIKKNKETDSEILERHDSNKNFRPKSKEIIHFNNNGELKDKRKELIHLVNKYLIEKQDQFINT